ncbi:MAG: hypothetical protein HY271_07085 [Deltaproteobacteria bacterium]|nr:hypothetical protein [Deltaproteobacteria bacterium]
MKFRRVWGAKIDVAPSHHVQRGANRSTVAPMLRRWREFARFALRRCAL